MLGSCNPRQRVGFRLIPFRSPLLRESRLLSFPLLREMFQFAEYLSTVLKVRGTEAFPSVGSPIRKSPVNSACLAAHRSLSQLATSFIDMQSQGIHVMRMSNVSYCSDVLRCSYAYSSKQYVDTHSN